MSSTRMSNGLSDGDLGVGPEGSARIESELIRQRVNLDRIVNLDLDDGRNLQLAQGKLVTTNHSGSPQGNSQEVIRWLST